MWQEEEEQQQQQHTHTHTTLQLPFTIINIPSFYLIRLMSNLNHILAKDERENKKNKKTKNTAIHCEWIRHTANFSLAYFLLWYSQHKGQTENPSHKHEKLKLANAVIYCPKLVWGGAKIFIPTPMPFSKHLHRAKAAIVTAGLPYLLLFAMVHEKQLNLVSMSNSHHSSCVILKQCMKYIFKHRRQWFSIYCGGFISSYFCP